MELIEAAKILNKARYKFSSFSDGWRIATIPGPYCRKFKEKSVIRRLVLQDNSSYYRVTEPEMVYISEGFAIKEATRLLEDWDSNVARPTLKKYVFTTDATAVTQYYYSITRGSFDNLEVIGQDAVLPLEIEEYENE